MLRSTPRWPRRTRIPWSAASTAATAFSAGASFPAGFRGVVYELERGDVSCTVQVTTFTAHRWQVWARRAYPAYPGARGRGTSFDRYALEVGTYLLAVDRAWARSTGMPGPPEPKAYEVAEEDGLYAEPPPYVIEGYENYRAYLEVHREIEGLLVGGLYEFWPTPGTLERLVALAPRGELFPNKELSMFQREARTFADRGGELSSMVELTAESFADMKPGFYFFGLDRFGRIRCGRELNRLEVLAAEERGVKLPRGNHALLFPGEELVSAGELRIGPAGEDAGGGNILLLLNADSGHFFYSNKTVTVREDIAVEGDRYFLTLGHVVGVLQEMQIPLEQMRIAKY